MSSIGKVIGLGAKGAGLCLIFALAFAPATALAAGHSNKPSSNTTAAIFTATTPSAACTTAKQALTKASTDDRAEGTLEKKNAKEAGAAAIDVTEDKTETRALKALRSNVHSACTTPACLASEKALKDAQTHDKAEGKTEKTNSTEKSTSDQVEDKLESAALKKLSGAMHTACASSTK